MKFCSLILTFFLVAYWVKDWANLIGLNTDLCIKHLQSLFPQAFYFLYFFAIPRNVIIACLNFLTLKLLCFLLSILCMHIFLGDDIIYTLLA